MASVGVGKVETGREHGPRRVFSRTPRPFVSRVRDDVNAAPRRLAGELAWRGG